MVVDKIDKGHLSSIKSVSFADENILASGARDGVINIWDLRLPNDSRNVLSISDAHKNKVTPKKSRRTVQRPSRSDPLNSVTSVLFKPNSFRLFSGGANDGKIKMWDIRQLRSIKPSKTITTHKVGDYEPSQVYSYSGSKSFSRSHGFTSLTFDAPSNSIFGNCSDHHIYGYDVTSGAMTSSFSGHMSNNFTRFKIVNDLVISGSTSGSAYIWPMDRNSFRSSNSVKNVWPSHVLCHFDEVTAVDGSDTTMDLFTCSDDQRLNKWSLLNLKIPKETDSRPIMAMPFKKRQVQVLGFISTNSMTTGSPETPPVRSVSSKNVPLTSLPNWLSKSAITRPSTNETTPNQLASRSATPSIKRKKTKENQKSIARPKRLFTPTEKKISDYYRPASI